MASRSAEHRLAKAGCRRPQGRTYRYCSVHEVLDVLRANADQIGVGIAGDRGGRGRCGKKARHAGQQDTGAGEHGAS